MVRSRVVVPLEAPTPFDGEALLVFFGRHAVPGVEAYRDEVHGTRRRIDYARTLRLASGPAGIELSWDGAQLVATMHLSDPDDGEEASRQIERLCDLGRDVVQVEAALSRDPHLAPLVAASPGLRVPGTVDIHEHLVRTMVGQQISLAAAANCAGKLVRSFGEPLTPAGALQTPAGPLTTLFPTPAALATADPDLLPMPAARARALVAVAQALANGTLELGTDSDPALARRQLLALRGVGPWTADYVLMRGLHEPDVLLASDLVIKRELVARGITDTSGWSPWRSYATMHLWRAWTG